MRRIIALAAIVVLAGPAFAQQAIEDAAVETVSGHKVRLRGFDLERRADGRVYVHGWARREPGRVGRINAHVHVEAFDPSGASLGVAEGAWNGTLSARERASRPIHVELARNPSARIVRIRISVEPGSRHE